jgi:hypothetical protein
MPGQEPVPSGVEAAVRPSPHVAASAGSPPMARTIVRRTARVANSRLRREWNIYTEYTPVGYPCQTGGGTS